MKAFECKMCGDCCYGEGGIRLEPGEVAAISRYLGMSSEAFQAEYCEIRNGRLYIKSGEDGYCIFHDPEGQCLIHPVNPLPCSLWPFYDALLMDREAWKEAQEACPGINPRCSYKGFVEQGRKIKRLD
ncbi:MAG: YkgJ family cysteine cluster protein [Deltaproteobacteria bacterium]|nr:YkgJ family cysteine cluster protein [Deltaproteobacteria bacterium]MBW2130629.1 YkgJ family cysteine cluster protein [Deltaproteobacteria bacterium]MBW2304527.1 YkgJ family cysteine cluster protein [Deltaproteobacteria bacterium]